jgi:hypothetical protein
LKAALEELRQLGPEARQVAEHARAAMRSYDMEAVQRIFSQFVVSAPSLALAGSSHAASPGSN